MTGPVEKLVLGRWGYSHDEIPDQSGKVILVTGGSAGLGFEVAKALAAKNARVIVTSLPSDLPQATEAMKGGEAQVNNASVTGLKDAAVADTNLQWEAVDFEDLNAVYGFATRLARDLDRLDVLICNAGIGVNQFKPTKDGFDRHLTINNLAHILLINHLLPTMRKTVDAPGTAAGSVRIVGQSSELHRPEALRDVRFASVKEFKEDVGSTNQYDRSKLGVILFDKAIVKNVIGPEGNKIKVYSTHPGAVATGQQDQLPEALGQVAGTLLKNATKPVFRSPEHGSLSILWASVAPDAVEYPQGSYFTDPKELGKESKKADDEVLVQKFWNTSQEVIKQAVGENALQPWNTR